MRVQGHRSALSEYRENTQKRRLYVTRTGWVFCTSDELEETASMLRIDNLIKDYYGVPGSSITETMIRVISTKISTKFLKGE